MKSTSELFLVSVLLTLLTGCDGNHPTEFETDGKRPPPFGGGVYIDPDVITSDAPTSFTELRDEGRDVRIVYDHRVSEQVSINAFVYTAVFDDGLTSEILVNPEYNETNSDLLRHLAEHHARSIGQLPATLRSDLRSVVIHPGVERFRGLFGQIFIYAERSAVVETEGFLEELLAHEAAHASLDVPHLGSPGWRDAQSADPTFISTYARDYPLREDVAESVVPWLAVRFRSDRISSEVSETIHAAIPSRLEYFDSVTWDLYPFIQDEDGAETAAR